jgi:molybdopterin/thiamine biosynthesis adenylyltransferase
MADLSRQEGMLSTVRLGSAKVGIIGSGTIANFLCAYLAGLGIGELVLVSDDCSTRRSSSLPIAAMSPDSSGKRTNLERLADVGEMINKDMRICSYHSRFNRIFTEDCSVIVDTTNSPDSKYVSMVHSRAQGSAYISCSSSATGFSVHAIREGAGDCGPGSTESSLLMARFARFAQKRQGSFTSGIAAAVAADEVRKSVHPLAADILLRGGIGYCIESEDRFSDSGYSSAARQPIYSRTAGKSVLVVGAGGIGTYALINLAMLGFDIELFDDDAVESHNLNRQVIHFGAEGSNKADEAARKLLRINPELHIGIHDYRLTREWLRQSRREGRRYDMIFSCVDNWSTRSELNDYARLTRTPVFNGGVSTFEALVDYFIPGKTHCLECSNDYRRRTREENEAENGVVSCGQLPANIVMPNAVAGSLMVAESMQVFSPSIAPMLKDARISYESNAPDDERFTVQDSSLDCGGRGDYRHNCRCHTYLSG